MATLSQQISNYFGGINEQPDERKLPGQVKDCINAIPNPVYGLLKRPGSKRIGTSPLATNKYSTSTIPSGGSWFHYYRDETAGSYIGQVDENGFIRIWSCNDGSEKNVWYATDNSVYSSGTASHTAISSATDLSPVTKYQDPTETHYAYLKTKGVGTSESIQTLTINDTTFIVNRDREIKTTGTTTGAAHTHYAYVELLRSENGRQYSMNIFDPSSTSTTDVKIATRIKLASDTLDEGNGSGHCPGIGTQVFNATSADSYSSPILAVEQNDGTDYNAAAGKKNLIFRITSTGQQGQGAGVDDGAYGPANYRCSYNRNLQLLHGGEGFIEGDKAQVRLTQASTSYDYTIEIEKIETVPVKGTINGGANGIIRPEPTPFDADTAVTADSILGGIVTELSGTGLSYSVIGNGIYIYSNSQDFSVEVVNNDIMRVMQSEVNNVADLPIQCKHGYIVKIANAQMSDEDDYYLKFEGENGQDGAGSWVECAKPGIVKSFNAATMPHILQRQADGDFLVKQYTWADREVGDDSSNLIPTFADGSSKINKVLFFRNRLVFLANDSVILSRAGKLNNFWANTALTVSATDPIDIACSSEYPSELFDGIEITAGLLVFSTNQQFLLASDDTIFNPDTAKLRAVAAYNYNKVVPPISLGQTKGFIDNSGKYSRFMEMADITREQEPAVMEASTVVPSLLPKDIDLITNSRENNLVFISKTNSDIVYIFKYLRVSQQRRDIAWFKWKFNNPLKYHFVVNDTYYLLDTDNFLQSVNVMQADTDPSIDQDNINYLLHLDNYTTVANGTYDAATKKTTFANQSDWIDDVTTPNGTLVLVDSDSNTAREGRYTECTVINTDDFTVPGNWSGATLHIGYLYDYQVDFPRIYLTKADGQSTRADVNSILTLHRINFSLGKIGLYETTLKRLGKPDYTEVYESTELDEYLVSDAPYVEEYIKTIPVYDKNSNVSITLKSTHPSPTTLRSMSWEGSYTPKYYNRA